MHIFSRANDHSFSHSAKNAEPGFPRAGVFLARPLTFRLTPLESLFYVAIVHHSTVWKGNLPRHLIGWTHPQPSAFRLLP
jgi:hypothetical protein